MRSVEDAVIVERLPGFVKTLLGRDMQSNITREYERALERGRFDFPACVELPVPCGRRLPERVVELLLARLSYRPGARVLDIGHGNAMECHRAMVRSLPAPRDLTGLDIAEPTYDVSTLYRESVRGDMGAMTFDDASFDLVWCISSLEHVGMDNSGYTSEFSRDERLAERAVQEMVRVTRPGGRVLLTVPYGRYENHGWFRNLDEAHLRALVDPVRVSVSVHTLTFAHRGERGWTPAPPEELRDVGYADQGNAGAAALAAVVLTKKG